MTTIFEDYDDAEVANQGLWNSGDGDKFFFSGDLVINDTVCGLYSALPESPDSTHPDDDRIVIREKSTMLIIRQMNEFYYMVFCSHLCKFWLRLG